MTLDNDSVCIKVTNANAVLNGVMNLEARQSDLLQNADKKKFSFVLANIIADIIIRLNADVADYMAPDAVYVMSGIIADRLDEVIASVENKGLEVFDTLGYGRLARGGRKEKACVGFLRTAEYRRGSPDN